MTFFDKDGEETHIKVPVGMSMLEAAHENDIELEGKLVKSKYYFIQYKILFPQDFTSSFVLAISRAKSTELIYIT